MDLSSLLLNSLILLMKNIIYILGNKIIEERRLILPLPCWHQSVPAILSEIW